MNHVPSLSGCYTLDARRLALPCFDLQEWAVWMAENDALRVVRQEQVGEHAVSTVFLGVDHNFHAGLDPVLFETMVFVDGEPVSRQRYSSWSQAETGHAHTVAMLQDELAGAAARSEQVLRAAAAKLKEQP